MKTRRRIYKLIVDIFGLVLFTVLGFSFITNLYNSDFKGFMEYAPHLFLGITTLCALSLGYTGVVGKEGRAIALRSSEKFFLSIILFIVALLPVIGILNASPKIINSDYFGVVSAILRIIGGSFLGLSLIIAHIGLSGIFDLLWERWNIEDRIVSKPQPTKKLEGVDDPFSGEKIELPAKVNLK